ncbi:hypothetical protein HYS79_01255 [Patescibacteria group bacterium]|nr:hypothetical protein [Patescibacteria group bacterium]
MMNKTRLLLAASFLLAALGFLLPLWPLSALGILLAGLSGRYLFAIAMGLLFDIAYGAPMGAPHFVWFPFTIIALAAMLGRALAKRYLLGRMQSETLY